MRRFRVFVHGKNFLLPNEGKVQRLGFFTTRFVTAADLKAAKVLAVESVFKHPNLFDSVANGDQDPPIVDIEEVEELPLSDDSMDTGLAFYVDEESN
jgi:hypothetical protein